MQGPFFDLFTSNAKSLDLLKRWEGELLTEAQAMALATQWAWFYQGATAPNPSVGAVALSEQGVVLGMGGHRCAGEPHAEVEAIQAARGAHSDSTSPRSIHTLVVTLEPCSHHGKTPPCTKIIQETGVQRVIYGCQDPNPLSRGKSKPILSRAGIEVTQASEPAVFESLIFGFQQRLSLGIPKITVKLAIDEKGSMLPPKNQKTFTRQSSLKLAHQLRRRADAIVTSAETILNDHPLFTVREVNDHPGKQRLLIIMDRRGRLSEATLDLYARRGFHVIRMKALDEGFRVAAHHGCNEVLVEAGPTLSNAVLSSSLWNEKIVIKKMKTHDEIQTFWNPRLGTRPRNEPPSPDLLLESVYV